MRYTSALLTIVLLIAHVVPQAIAADPLLPGTAGGGSPPAGRLDRTWQGIPGLERTAGGRVFVCWFSGGPREPAAENTVLLCHSDDGGETFGQPYIMGLPNADGTRCFDPTVWIDPRGRLWYIFNRGNKDTAAHGVWARICDDPDATPPVFGPEVRIGYDAPYAFRMNKPTVLSSGEWIMPVTHAAEPIRDWFAGAKQLQGVGISTDEGRTWKLHGAVRAPHWALECMITELPDGRLWMLIRTGSGFLWESHSADRGRTWSEARASTIANPGSRFFIRRLESGRLLLVNHYRFTGRSHLTARISSDEGATWNDGLLLDERSGVSYPDGVQDRDGLIWISYDRERHGAGEILLARFREEDVLAGQDVSGTVRLKQVVDRLPRGMASRLQSRGRLWADGIDQPPVADSRFPAGIRHVRVERSDTDRYGFLHDPAIAEHKGQLLAAWYNCPEHEIVGESLIRGRRSPDGGDTWSAIEVIARDSSSDGTHYVPAQLLSHQGVLHAFVGKMTGHDLITACAAFTLDEAADRWVPRGDIAERFLPNCQPVRMEDGNWIMAGRLASRLGVKPVIPAVAISAGDRLLQPWRVVPLQAEEFAAGQCPETTVWLEGNELVALTRNNSAPAPYLYASTDWGRSWQKLPVRDFSAVTAKMYAGRLSTGQYYVAFNYPSRGEGGGRERSVLALALSRPGEAALSQVWRVQDNSSPDRPSRSHYPSVIEHQGRLLVLYTAETPGASRRQCELAIIPLDSLQAASSGD